MCSTGILNSEKGVAGVFLCACVCVYACYLLQNLQPGAVFRTSIHQAHLAEVSCGVGKRVLFLCRAVHLLLFSALVISLLLSSLKHAPPSFVAILLPLRG